jgi:hypothetical protein
MTIMVPCNNAAKASRKKQPSLPQIQENFKEQITHELAWAEPWKKSNVFYTENRRQWEMYPTEREPGQDI